jgi:hypothetical protein
VVVAKKKPHRPAVPQVASKPDALPEVTPNPIPQEKPNGVAQLKVKLARVRRRRTARPRLEASSEPAAVLAVVEELVVANESASQTTG